MPTRTIKLTSEDLASVRRVLGHFGDDDERARQAGPRDERLRALAQGILEMRSSRTAFLNRAMLGEPAYEMLLHLYVGDESGEGHSPARLAELAGVPQSSALRWIDYLASKGLVLRNPHPNDRRATVVGLTPQGKDGLSAMLQQIDEAGILTRAG